MVHFHSSLCDSLLRVIANDLRLLFWRWVLFQELKCSVERNNWFQIDHSVTLLLILKVGLFVEIRDFRRGVLFGQLNYGNGGP